MSAPDRVWWYAWPDGRAVVEQRGTCGVLWLYADLVAGRYAWDAWGGERPGADFRAWLASACERSPDYVVGKLCYGRPDIFDPEATDRAVRDLILRERRADRLTAEEARERWDDWVEDFMADGHDASDVYRWLSEHDVCEAWEFLRYRRHGADDFARHLPLLAERLRADLARPALKELAAPGQETPALTGEDAERLLADLERRCSVEEAAARVEWAGQMVAWLQAPPATRGPMPRREAA